LTLKIDFINDMAFRYGDLQEALIKMREAIASLELAFSDDPSFFTAPIAINELHEFLSVEGREPTLETYELRAVHA
jgi:hypothetical protein